LEFPAAKGERIDVGEAYTTQKEKERLKERRQLPHEPSQKRTRGKNARQKTRVKKEKKRFIYTKCIKIQEVIAGKTHTKHLGRQLQVLHQPAPSSIHKRQNSKI